MEIRAVKAKTITGIQTRTDNATEMNAATGKIAQLWQTFDQTVPVNYRGGERVYGVYANYESDHTGRFDVLAGFDGTNAPDNEQLREITIEAGKYLVFTHQGNMPQIAIDAWTEVWQYFTSGNAQHQRLFTTDFEYYPSDKQIEVHIAIK